MKYTYWLQGWYYTYDDVTGILTPNEFFKKEFGKLPEAPSNTISGVLKDEVIRCLCQDGTIHEFHTESRTHDYYHSNNDLYLINNDKDYYICQRNSDDYTTVGKFENRYIRRTISVPNWRLDIWDDILKDYKVLRGIGLDLSDLRFSARLNFKDQANLALFGIVRFQRCECHHTIQPKPGVEKQWCEFFVRVIGSDKTSYLAMDKNELCPEHNHCIEVSECTVKYCCPEFTWSDISWGGIVDYLNK